MIPMERRTGEPQEFPFLGLAVMLLALHAIFAVTLQPSPLRSAVALAAFFAMGYAALALIADGNLRLSAAEVLAFTVGLTILLTSLSALGVSIVGIRITEFAVVIIGLPVGVLAWLLRRPRRPWWTAVREFTRSYFDFSEYTAGEKGIAAVLLVAIGIALAAFISLAWVHFPDQPTMGLAVTWPNMGEPGSFNRTFRLNVPQRFTATVLADDRGGSFTLRVSLVPSNASGSEPLNTTTGPPTPTPLRLRGFDEYRESLTIAAGVHVERGFDIIIEELGVFDLRIELLNAASTSVASFQVLEAQVF
jgi:hypothetical protein